jgi:hypothetical protein
MSCVPMTGLIQRGGGQGSHINVLDRIFSPELKRCQVSIIEAVERVRRKERGTKAREVH